MGARTDPRKTGQQKNKKKQKKSHEHEPQLCRIFVGNVYYGDVHVCFLYRVKNTEIASLQTDLNELKSDNDAMENSNETSVDLDEVYKIATEKLNMHYPTEKQIVSYSTDGSGYVRQYSNVSGNKK